jgi:hypothetical protein
MSLRTLAVALAAVLALAGNRPRSLGMLRGQGNEEGLATTWRRAQRARAPTRQLGVHWGLWYLCGTQSTNES